MLLIVLQCDSELCGVLQGAAVCCSVLPGFFEAMLRSVLQCCAVCCSDVQRVAVWFGVAQ